MPIKPLRILVVDDHRDSLRLLGTLLVVLGHTPNLVSNASRALAMAREEVFDVLLTDVHMPAKDGWKLVQELKAGNWLPPRVISMSAGILDFELERSGRFGCYAHLQKPFRSQEVEKALS